MSHMSKVKTQIRNLDTLERVLREMGYTVQRGENLHVSSYYGENADRADIVFDTDRSQARRKNLMGFQKNGDGTYDFVGDSWGSGLNFNAELGQITAGYAEGEVMEQFQANPELADFQLASRETDKDGNVVLNFERW